MILLPPISSRSDQPIPYRPTSRAARRPELSLCPGPAAIPSLIALLPGGPITRDQLAMLGRDNVAAPGAKGLAHLGVVPTPMPAVAEKWLVRYRKHGRDRKSVV